MFDWAFNPPLPLPSFIIMQMQIFLILQMFTLKLFRFQNNCRKHPFSFKLNKGMDGSYSLTHFMSVMFFYNPWKSQKTSFLSKNLFLLFLECLYSF